MNPLRSLPEYEIFVYTLAQRYPLLRRSTLVVARRGAAIALLNGEIEWAGGIRLVVREKLSFPTSSTIASPRLTRASSSPISPS
jgi:hypothetical protein